MKHALRISACLIGMTLLLGSCGISKLKDIAITSVGVSYIVPTSTRSMDAKLELGIHNPAMSFAVEQVSGAIKYNDKSLAHFVTGEVELEGKTDQVYQLPCTVTLDPEISLLDVLVVASRRSLEGLKADIDVQAALKKNGALKAPLSFKDVDISQFSK